MKTSVLIQTVSSKRFVAAIEEKIMNDLGRAKRDYLLCKAAIERRKQELVALHREGRDTGKLDRMIKRLESSRDVHHQLITRLEDK